MGITSQTLDGELRSILAQLCGALGFIGAGLLLRDECGDTLTVYLSEGLPDSLRCELDSFCQTGSLVGQLASGPPGIVPAPPASSAGLWMSAPLVAAETVLGLLLLARPADERGPVPDPSADPTLRAGVESVARAIGLALFNARHVWRHRRRAEQLRVVSEIGRRITAIREPSDLLQAMVEQIQKSFGYSHVGVALLENDRPVIKAAARPPERHSRGGSDRRAEETSLPIASGSLIDLVAATGEPRLFSDLSASPDYHPLTPTGPVRSQLAVPLRFEDQVIGVLYLESDRPNAFDENDLMLAEVLAAQVAVAIANARHYHEARRRTQEVEALLDTAQDINSELDLILLLQRVTQRALEITGAEGALVGHVEGDGHTLSKAEMVYQTIRTPRAWIPYDARFPLTEGWLGETVRRRQPYLTNDAVNDPHSMPDFVAAFQIRAALNVPILSRRGVLLGAIHVFNCTPGRHFGPGDVRLLTAFANQAAIAFENARLYEIEREKVESLQELERLKSEFLSSVSHDLRTPLTTLRTASHVFPDAGPLTPLQKRLIENIQRNTERMTILVNDLLEMAKLQSSRLRLNYQYFDLVRFLEELIEEVNPLLEKQDLRAEIVVPEGELSIMADPRRLHQVLLNLLTNAIRLSPAGGTITLSATPDTRPAAGRPAGVTISVRDQGPGIPEAEQQRIFDQFYRLDSRGSSGLGLAIAQRLVALHEGHITVESTPGNGATFSVWLPLEVDRDAE